MSNYILTKHRFTVAWGGTNIGFQEVSGLGFEQEVVSYQHGAMINGTAPMKSPGRIVYTETLTLSRGYFRGDNEMKQWFDDISQDETQRRTIVITLLDETQTPAMSWTVYKAWPSQIEGLSLSAGSSEGSVESITIQHEGYSQQMH